MLLSKELLFIWLGHSRISMELSVSGSDTNRYSVNFEKFKTLKDHKKMQWRRTELTQKVRTSRSLLGSQFKHNCTYSILEKIRSEIPVSNFPSLVDLSLLATFRLSSSLRTQGLQSTDFIPHTYSCLIRFSKNNQLKNKNKNNLCCQ